MQTSWQYMPGESRFNPVTSNWRGELGVTGIGNIWDLEIK